MKRSDLRAEHFKSLYLRTKDRVNELEERVKLLSQENRAFKEELRESRTHMAKLKKSLDSLRSELLKKEVELSQKEGIISLINRDMKLFNQEFEKTISDIKIKLKDIDLKKVKEEKRGILEHKLSDNKEFLFPINIDANFLYSSSTDILKYYLYTIGVKEALTFELKEFNIDRRVDLINVGHRFSSYLIEEAMVMGYEVEGVIEVKQADIFERAKLLAWVTDRDFTAKMFEEFAKKDLQNKIYNHEIV